MNTQASLGRLPVVAPRRRDRSSVASGVLGAAAVFAVALLLWQGLALALALRTPIADQFGPWPAAQALWEHLLTDTGTPPQLSP